MEQTIEPEHLKPRKNQARRHIVLNIDQKEEMFNIIKVEYVFKLYDLELTLNKYNLQIIEKIVRMYFGLKFCVTEIQKFETIFCKWT